MKFLLKKRILIPLILVLVFLLGPRPNYPEIQPKIKAISMPLDQLDAFIAEKESKVEKLRPDNESRIVWADSIRKTPFAIVFLHGFSASPMECDPISFDFAKRYGFNMYLPRLAGHGIDDIESFKDLSPAELIESAKEALAIGKLLGDRVIIMASSTGATLGTYLAAENPTFADALIYYSPNFQIGDKKSAMLTLPWGLQLARLVFGGNHRSYELNKKEAYNYWTTKYRLEGVVCLKHLVNATMTSKIFKKISQPVMVGYYYKNEEEFDHIISMEAIQQFFNEIKTPKPQQLDAPFSTVDSHVIASHFQSKDVEIVRKTTFEFAEKVLGLIPIKE